MKYQLAMKYQLESTKGKKTIDGTLEEAVMAAKTMEAELQPAGGVDVCTPDRDAIGNVEDGEWTLFVYRVRSTLAGDVIGFVEDGE